MTDLGPPGRVDGRTRRGERTRRAIVDAHLALLGEGDLKPTGGRIADRAGVSLRTLWTNFRDLETLFAASNERLMQLQAQRARPVPPDLPLPHRVAEFCRQRAETLEALAPAARAAQIREPFSAQLRHNRRAHIDRTRAEIDTLFRSELDSAGPGREQLRDAVTVACTWAAWSMLRDEMGLDPNAARGVMVRTITALFAAAFAATHG